MKKLSTLWARNIKSNKTQLFSIAVIIFLGVSFLTGILATTPTMKASLNQYIDDTNMYDIRIDSYRKVDDIYLDEIRKLSEIKSIKTKKNDEFWIRTQDNKYYESRIYFDITDEDKNFELVEGRFPKNKEEIVLAVSNNFDVDKNNLDNIYITKTKDKDEVSRYKVVGFVKTPMMISILGENGKIGAGKIKILGFTKDINENHKESLFLNLTKKRDVFDKTYKGDVDNVFKEVEKISKKDKFNFWNISKIDDLTGFTRLSDDIDKVQAISKIFPVFFFLVAFLVVTTSMTRIIDDKRKEIGSIYSIGYKKRSIYVFYLSYGFIMSVIGSILGSITGFLVFPPVIAKAYSIGYNFPDVRILWMYNLAMIISVISICVVLLSILLILKETLKEKPANLFIYNKEIGGNRIFLERINFFWSALSFHLKITLRNIFRYKKRLFMTVLGVSGCFALVLSSFGMKDSIEGIVKNQFDYIEKYNMAISIDSNQFINNIYNKDYVDSSIFVLRESGKIDGVDKTYKASITVAKKLDDLSNFIDYNYDHKVNSDDGILMSSKLGELLNIKSGDFVELDIDDEVRKVKVVDFFKNYVGHQIIIKEDYFKKYWDNKTSNTILLKTNLKEENVSDKIEEIMKEKGVLYAYDTGDIKNSFNKSIDNLNYIILVLNISAGLLTFIIIYNLTNINIIERFKELATIKVLGFHKKEVENYIFREVNIMSFFGIIIGIPLGKLLHYFVINKMEVGGISIDKIINLDSYMVSAFIIGLFVVITNLTIKKKISKINMVEAMKAND